ncbi:MAG: hypothetical protein KDD43_12390, partial [Bdellovibrionales bacterium]|nr:hypothetical protein [Bdellovibrionales bacterium]
MEKDFMIRPIVFFYASLLFLPLASLEAIAQSPTPGCIRATPALTLSPEKQTALSGEMKYYNLNIR